MKIYLSDDTMLEPITVIGGKRTVQGATRDVLQFVFPMDTSMDNLDSLFTESNCEKIIIEEDDGNQYIHNAYTVRVELKREPLVITPATEDEAAVVEHRVIVAMGQRTYAETQLASLTETVDVLVMESLMAE